MSPRLVAIDSSDKPESSYANNAMTRLWQDAPDRQTGAEAVEAIRARRQQEREPAAKDRGGSLRRFLLGR